MARSGWLTDRTAIEVGEMMRQERLNRIRDLAQRVIDRSRAYETRFSEFASPDDFPRDIVTAVTEGSLGGIRYGTWLPIAGPMYRDESMRESVINRAREVWRMHAFSHIHRPSMLVGPKGKLPA